MIRRQSGFMDDVQQARGTTSPTTIVGARGMRVAAPTTNTVYVPPRPNMTMQEIIVDMGRKAAELDAIATAQSTQTNSDQVQTPAFVDHNNDPKIDAMQNDVSRSTRTSQAEVIQQSQNVNAQNSALVTQNKALQTVIEQKQQDIQKKYALIGSAMLVAFMIFKKRGK